jgi:hypothetical protein
MTAARVRTRAAVQLLTCACLLLVFTGLALSPLAVLLPGQNDCNCGCQHETGKLCCCRRAARNAGSTFESAAGCPGNCRHAVPFSPRLLYFPLATSAATSLTALCPVDPAGPVLHPDVHFSDTLRDRSPPC